MRISVQMRRRLLVVLGVVAVGVLVAVGLSQTGTDNEAPRSATAVPRVDPATLPPRLGAIVRRANRIERAAPKRVVAEIDALEGTPVVVNKWASWCGPCRYEFPFFQQAAAKYAGRIAFLGLNSGDNRGDAQRFLRRFPVPYPSFEDPNEKTALALEASAAYPVTIFIDASGERFVHQGGYATLEALERDLREHALS